MAGRANTRHNCSSGPRWLSLYHAEDAKKQAYYLAAAIYAYAFLFPENPAEAPNEYDPRLTTALDIYNRAIAAGLASPDGTEIDLSERPITLPFGSLDVQVDRRGFSYGGYRLTKFVSLADLQVRGMRNTYCKAGIGALYPRASSRRKRAPPTGGYPRLQRFRLRRSCASTIRVWG